jgi:Protein of unknown function (DUF1656)
LVAQSSEREASFKSKRMIYEIPIAGVQIAAFVVLAIGSLAVTAAICALIEKFQLVEWLWNPPLFFLGLWACLGLGAALFYYGS